MYFSRQVNVWLVGWLVRKSRQEKRQRRGISKPQRLFSRQERLNSVSNCNNYSMNPAYSPAPSGVPFANPKGIGYPAGFPVGYAAATPAYSPNMYPGANTAFPTGYTPGTPYKMSCSPGTGAVPPYSSSPNPYQAAVYPMRSSYPSRTPMLSKALTTRSPCMRLPRTSSTTPPWCSPTGCQPPCSPRPSLSPVATASPWEW
ncbi:hypothetical protein ANANG_G00083420 [Anguilla anguilla]|uniref:Uncharacterized protein n=1 Tax=Anguilla anguilla TaxID=7936 RepID=A0A9D3S0X7_ANGAN|nr:hypothetical protein ANANG_G00083420 [Anguilla anguilla]